VLDVVVTAEEHGSPVIRERFQTGIGILALGHPRPLPKSIRTSSSIAAWIASSGSET
jgi:hypothetical protein